MDAFPCLLFLSRGLTTIFDPQRRFFSSFLHRDNIVVECRVSGGIGTLRIVEPTAMLAENPQRPSFNCAAVSCSCQLRNGTLMSVDEIDSVHL